MTEQIHPSADETTEDAPTTFAELGLSPEVLDAVADLGYDVPTPVQAQAIPAVLAGHDVMAAAQTGTGKTAAFLLPSLDRLDHARRHEGPLMLVVTPTRELAQQIETVATTICAHTRHRSVVVVGGLSYDPQTKALERGCDLLIATPGRLLDLIHQGACDLSQVRTLVLDEADRMLDMGFLPDVRKIVAELPADRQTLLFSATLDDSVLDHTRALVHDPVRVEIAPRGTTAQTVEQYALGVSHDAKPRVLLQLLQREGWQRVIVFCNGKHRVDSLCRKLRRAGISCLPIHGNRTQNQRQHALQQFADGMVDVLVATDVLARGIDVPDVAYVVNYDIPHDDTENYIHRIGRTGRAGEEGWAVSLVAPEDYLYLRDVEQLTGQVIPDYPRADGMDLGEEPTVLDPRRDPREKLPSKKARKAMERRAQKSREKGSGSGHKHGDKKATAAPDANAPQVKATKDSKGSKSKPKSDKSKSKGKAKAAQPATRRPRRDEVLLSDGDLREQRKHHHKDERRKGSTSDKSSPKAKKPGKKDRRPRHLDTRQDRPVVHGPKRGRHPGDHGGRN